MIIWLWLYHYGDAFYSNRQWALHQTKTSKDSPLPQEVKQYVQDLVAQGVLQEKESSSPWASPAVVVMKKVRYVHLCCDYQKLNNITHRDDYPFPRVEESLDTLVHARFSHPRTSWQNTSKWLRLSKTKTFRVWTNGPACRLDSAMPEQHLSA